jgi:hypothetical protein
VNNVIKIFIILGTQSVQEYTKKKFKHASGVCIDSRAKRRLVISCCEADYVPNRTRVLQVLFLTRKGKGEDEDERHQRNVNRYCRLGIVSCLAKS